MRLFRLITKSSNTDAMGWNNVPSPHPKRWHLTQQSTLFLQNCHPHLALTTHGTAVWSIMRM